MFNKARCYNGGNKHKYRAVYTDGSALSGSKMNSTVWGLYSMPNIIKAARQKNYIGHVCEWCGAVVDRRD